MQTVQKQTQTQTVTFFYPFYLLHTVLFLFDKISIKVVVARNETVPVEMCTKKNISDCPISANVVMKLVANTIPLNELFCEIQSAPNPQSIMYRSLFGLVVSPNSIMLHAR